MAMVQIGNAVVSSDVLTETFCCDVASCHGQCCVEGDAGAPVTLEEIAALEEALPAVWEELSPEAREVIDRQGVAYTDVEGDLVTSIVGGRECVFAGKEGGGCLCLLERAFRQGRTRFRKPLSCQLYPLRVSDFGAYKAVNYHRWAICRTAVARGAEQGVPLYRFLKEPLTERFGREWYDELETTANEMKRQGII